MVVLSARRSAYWLLQCFDHSIRSDLQLECTNRYSTPLISGNSVFGTLNGAGTTTQTVISSFALSNGAVNWSYAGNFLFPSQAAVGGGLVTFVGTPRGSSTTSLYVLDSITGALRYSVPVPEGLGSGMPTMVQNPVTGAVTAFVADASHVSAVSLGATSGSVLWSQAGSFGGFSHPTVAGNSVVLAGPGQYYAFDQSTGAANHFHASGISGGGGTTTTYDAVRHQLYVSTSYDSAGAALSAYRYIDNDHITLLWQRTGAGVSAGVGSVAIGPTGNVYSVGSTAIWELDPATGETLRTISGAFGNAETPILSDGVVWAISGAHIVAYDLLTLQLLRSLNGGTSSNQYFGPGAIADGYFLVDHGNIVGQPGFDVYSMPVPEPATIVLLAIAALGGVGARRVARSRTELMPLAMPFKRRFRLVISDL